MHIGEVYKSAKLAEGANRRQARVDDEATDRRSNDDEPEVHSPEVGPGEDEEGRFFGGGLSKEEAEILDYVDARDNGDAAPEHIDAAWLRKTALSLEKRINKNAELRARFEGEPAKFIDSEADLDSEIKTLSVLSEHAHLYPEFARLGCVSSLAGLLSHENTDIAIDALEIIGELTDEDVQAEEEQWHALADALLDADLIDLVLSNLKRFDEQDESDRIGVYAGLAIVENLCSRSATAERAGTYTKLLEWLLGRAGQREQPVTQNKQYAAELLAILAQASPLNRKALCSLDAVDILLQLSSSYRKRNPDKGTDEEEYMEDLFEALTCLVDDVQGKAKFLEAEGVELCLIMLKEGQMSKVPALRLLDHATTGSSGSSTCYKIVEAGGLKTTFTLFMKKNDSRSMQHLLSLFSSMLQQLPGDSEERVRFLIKFVENDFQKIHKLFHVRADLQSRVREENTTIKREASGAGVLGAEELAMLEGDWALRRLDAGLYSLQTMDVILTWLMAEDKGASKLIREQLANSGESLSTLQASLKDQVGALEESSESSEQSAERRLNLEALIEFLG